jgi:hypothetical protein
MNEHDQLREQMWDLVYGLTAAEETAALHARIKSDRAVARMYAEVRLEADLVAEAAKVEDTSITLPELAPQKERAIAGRAKEASKAPAASGAGGWSLHWLGVAAASALALLMAVGIFWQKEAPQQEVTQLIRFNAYSTTDLVRGVQQEFSLQARDAEGNPVPAAIRSVIVDADGKSLYEQNVTLDDAGSAQMPVPGDVIKPGNQVRFYLEQAAAPEQQVAQRTSGPVPDSAARNDHAEELRELDQKAEPLVEARLLVRDEPRVTRFAADKDWYAPGDVVQWRLYRESAFTHQPQAVDSLELKLIDPEGNSLPPEEVLAQSETGVVTGTFRLPVEAAKGRYALSVQDTTRGEAQTNGMIFVGREFAQLYGYPGQSDSLETEKLANVHQKREELAQLDQAGALKADSAPAEPASHDRSPGKAKLNLPAAAGRGGTAFGGALAGGAPAGGPEPAPAPSAPQPEGAPPGANAPAPQLAKDKSGIDPASVSELELAGERSRLESRLGAEHGKALDDFKKLTEPVEHSIDFAVPPTLAGKPFIVEARYRDLVVSKKEVPAVENDVRDKSADGAINESLGRTLSLPLPPQVDGDVDLYFFDSTASSPKAVHATRVQIAPRNGLEIQVADADEKYAPGQTVRVKVQVKEGGQAAPNVALAFRVAPSLATAGELGADQGFEGAGGSFLERAGRDAKFDKGMDAPAAGAAKGDESRNNLRRRSAQLAEVAPKTAGRAPEKMKPGAGGPAPPSVATRGIESDPAKTLDESEARLESFQRFGESAQVTDMFAKLAEPQQPAQPMLLASNDAAVRQKLAEREAADAAREARLLLWRKRIGRGLLLGGVLLLVVLGIAVFVQRPDRARLWVPSLAVAAASFVVGFMWLLGQPRTESQALAKRESAATAVDAPPPMSAAPATPPSVDSTAAVDAEFAPSSAGGGLGGFGGGGGRSDSLHTVPGSDGRAPGGIPAADDAATSTDGSQPAADASKKVNVPEDAAESSEEPRKKSPAGLVPKAAEAKGELLAAKGMLDRVKGEKESVTLNKSVVETPAPPGERSKRKAEKDDKDADRALKENLESLLADSQTQGAVRPEMGGRDFAKGFGKEGKQAAGSLWQPLLVADENGEVVIEFTMPDEPGEYNLMLDAHGPGRVGKLRKVIRSEVQPAAASVKEAK